MDSPALSLAESDLDRLRAYARTFPSQGGVEIGDVLESLAADVFPGSAIVEIGSWLGAGTAHLALGAMQSRAPIHVYDRWQASSPEVEKAARFGVTLTPNKDTLPLVMSMLEPFRQVEFNFHKGSIKQLYWSEPQKVGLYVDDATKIAELWGHAMDTFAAHFIPHKTHLVLMDYHFDEKAGEKYAAQKRYMAAHKESFELMMDRVGGTSTAIFKFLGFRC